MAEEWKDIPGTNYFISNRGRVMNDKHLILKQYIMNGYPSVTLNKNRTKFRVHRLVAEAFIENTHNKPFVNHKDSNKENNNVSNLEWVTAEENMRHFYDKHSLKKVGLRFTSDKGEVMEFPSIQQASEYFGIDRTTMWGASLHGNMWGMKITRLNDGKVVREKVTMD